MATFLQSGPRVLLHALNLTSLSFIFRSVLLLFKREFVGGDLLQLWESFLAADRPWAYAQFVAPSILLFTVLKLLLHARRPLGEAIGVVTAEKGKTPVQSVLRLVSALLREIGLPRRKEAAPKGTQIWTRLSKSGTAKVSQ
jgi:hypothetical protein